MGTLPLQKVLNNANPSGLMLLRRPYGPSILFHAPAQRLRTSQLSAQTSEHVLARRRMPSASVNVTTACLTFINISTSKHLALYHSVAPYLRLRSENTISGMSVCPTPDRGNLVIPRIFGLHIRQTPNNNSNADSLMILSCIISSILNCLAKILAHAHLNQVF